LLPTGYIGCAASPSSVIHGERPLASSPHHELVQPDHCMVALLRDFLQRRI
jgi:hypothetical protein